MEERQSRKLAAIMAADIAGYSALMGADEARTVRDLKEHQAVVLPMIGEFGGRIIDTAGDGILAEFASVVNAVRCAVAVQKELARVNASIEPERQMHLRIGINLGDVIFDETRIYGDGINVAARLEGLAQPGGICISGKVYEEIRGKLDLVYDDLGEQRLKNIAQPVHVYGVRTDAAPRPARARPDTGAQAPARPPRRWSARAVAGAALSAALMLAAVAWFALLDRPDVLQRGPPPRPAAVSAMPVVAVLPFANQSGDESQDYFADGVTEEVINALGRFNTLRVIGRNTVLRYKKRPPTQEEITSELGANYLVGGSVRHSGNRVRIAAQLTEARAGTVMWSDRYDGELADIFDFQDNIARQIAGTLAANIALVEGRRQLDHPRPNQTAFDLVLRARATGHAGSRPTNRQFRELVSKAIELDPNYAAARALLAEALYSQAVLGWTEFPDQDLSRAAAEAQKAIALAPNDPDGYRALGRILVTRGEYDQAQNAAKRAVEINPSDANALAVWGVVQSFSGEIGAAVELLELALKLDSMLDPNYVFDLTLAYYLARRNEDTLRIAERGLARYPEFFMFNASAAAAAARLGRKDQAARYVEALRRRLPFFKPEMIGSRFKDPAHPAYLREGLKLAGL